MEPITVIESQDIKKIKDLFKRPTFTVDPEEAIEQYKVGEHDVFSKEKRPMRKIKRDTGTINTETGKPNVIEMLVDVVRVGVPYQKIITKRRVGFMLSEPVTIRPVFKGEKETESEKKLVAMVASILDANKMDYANKDIFRRKLSECEVAVIWYYMETGETSPKFTLGSKIVSPDLGDTLYPLFDAYGTLISFARGYTIVEDGEKIEHYDVYTKDFEYYYVDRKGWILDKTIPINPIPNKAQKLMIEYYKQDAPVWFDVQSMIDRYETLTSNHGGMNDKFGAPLLTVTGEIMGVTGDNATGNILQLENGATAQYQSLSAEPGSISLEQANLVKNIYTMSQTPDISFEAMKGIGNATGIALKLLFADAHMACSDEEESFGLGIQRRLNIIKNAIGMLIDTSLAPEAKTVQLKPVFHPYLPSNITELVDVLSVAVTGGYMSKETAVELNPLITDKEVEKQRVDAAAAKDFQTAQ